MHTNICRQDGHPKKGGTRKKSGFDPDYEPPAKTVKMKTSCSNIQDEAIGDGESLDWLDSQDLNDVDDIGNAFQTNEAKGTCHNDGGLASSVQSKKPMSKKRKSQIGRKTRKAADDARRRWEYILFPRNYVLDNHFSLILGRPKLMTNMN